MLETLLKQEEKIWVEARSYFPLEAFRYGYPATACRLLRNLTSAELKRRGYHEVSFAALEAYAEGLMGIEADAASNSISTLSRLPTDSVCGIMC